MIYFRVGYNYILFTVQRYKFILNYNAVFQRVMPDK